MAGIPALRGLFGTFSGTQGLDLTPVLADARQKILQQQLAQEAQKAQAQQALQSRGLDLTERGQDIGREEAELARVFQENLLKMRNEFDEGEAQKQRDAAVAAQQRQIQEMQRAQSSSQEFQSGEAIAAFERGAPERTARIATQKAQEELATGTLAIRKAQEEERIAIDALRRQIAQHQADNLPTKDEMAELKKHEKRMRELTLDKFEAEVDEIERRAFPIMEQANLNPLELKAFEDAIKNRKDLPIEVQMKFAQLPDGTGIKFIEDMRRLREDGDVAESIRKERELQNKLVDEQMTAEAASLRERIANASAAAHEKKAGIVGRDENGDPIFEGDPDAPDPKEAPTNLSDAERRSKDNARTRGAAFDEAGDVFGKSAYTVHANALEALDEFGGRDDPAAEEAAQLLREFSTLVQGNERTTQFNYGTSGITSEFRVARRQHGRNFGVFFDWGDKDEDEATGEEKRMMEILRIMNDEYGVNLVEP